MILYVLNAMWQWSILRCADVSVLPGTELAEGLEGGGGHVAESIIITQQQESQHLKPQQHKHMSYAQHDQKE